MDHSIDQLIQCAQREVRLREAHFPELIKEGSLSDEEAQSEINLMIQIGENLIKIKNGNIQSL